jgi:hypothetical protein
MKSVKKITFEADLVMEYSHSPKPVDLGRGKCSMELFTEDGTINQGVGDIEWIYFIGTPREDVTQIGVWWKGLTLSDYDGVFSLPNEAIKLLRKCKIIVPEEFENA